jgi:hypothetical protein
MDNTHILTLNAVSKLNRIYHFSEYIFNEFLTNFLVNYAYNIIFKYHFICMWKNNTVKQFSQNWYVPDDGRVVKRYI